MNQQKELRRLHKKLWKIVSLAIRKEEAGRCFTCGIVKPISEMHCGHYHDASISNPELNFYRRNLHCQCPRCNLFLSGNKTEYAYRLIKKYGGYVLDELMQLKNTCVKWSLLDYENAIKYWEGRK